MGEGFLEGLQPGARPSEAGEDPEGQNRLNILLRVPIGLQSLPNAYLAIWALLLTGTSMRTVRPKLVPVALVLFVLTLGLSPGTYGQVFAGLTPDAVRKYYDVTPLIQSGYTGKGVTVAVVAQSANPGYAVDIEHFDSYNGLPGVNLTTLEPFGSLGTTSGTQLELTGDIELIHAMAPDADIVVVLAGNNSILSSVSYLIDHSSVDIISTSEFEWDAGHGAAQWASAVDANFSRSVARNITLITTSGDSGANNTVPFQGITPAWASYGSDSYSMPTYDPYFTVVGGTQFVLRGWTPVGEEAWNASGGGPSNLFAQPSWQAASGVPKNGFRDIPDLSLDSSCQVPYSEVWEDESITFCGTSAAAPVFAGIIADVEQAAGHRLGFLNPSLYALARSDPSAFNDIVSGYSFVDSGGVIQRGYCATKGWDFVTGLGSPDAVRLLHYFAPNASLNATASIGRPSSNSTVSTTSSCPPIAGRTGLPVSLIFGILAASALGVVAVAVFLRRGRPKAEEGAY